MPVFTVSQPNQTLAAFVREVTNLSWSKARERIERKLVKVGPTFVTNPAFRLKVGVKIEVLAPGGTPAKATAAPAKPKKVKEKPTDRWSGPLPVIRYSDDAIIIVEKPAGLTTMRHPEEVQEFEARGRKYLPPTLADLLPELLHEPAKTIRAVHRIDRDTSGLVAFARTAEAEKHLTDQFRNHSIERRYLALVRGNAVSARIESVLIRDRGDGRRGSTDQPTEEGQIAITHVKLLEDLGEFSLVECRLETGRTHQVRIHLGEAGTPLCGEKIYDRPIHGSPFPDGSHADRPALHATHLALTHPETGDRLEWNASLPEDMQRWLKGMQKRK